MLGTILFFLGMGSILVITVLNSCTILFKKGKTVELGGNYKFFYQTTKRIRKTTLILEIDGKIVKNNIIKVEAYNGFIKDIYESLDREQPFECKLTKEKEFQLEEQTKELDVLREVQKFEQAYLKELEPLAVAKVAKIIKVKKIIKNAKRLNL